MMNAIMGLEAQCLGIIKGGRDYFQHGGTKKGSKEEVRCNQSCEGREKFALEAKSIHSPWGNNAEEPSGIRCQLCKLHALCRAQHRAQTQNREIKTRVEIKSQTLNRASHAGLCLMDGRR
ncbi:uncharacterized protein LOC144324117 isoform X2 [Canis aureus]